MTTAFDAWTQPGIIDPALLSAKTVAVLPFGPETHEGVGGFLRDLMAGSSQPNRRTAKESAEAGIRNIKRYTLIDDPAKADLLLYVFMWRRWGDTWSQLSLMKIMGDDKSEPQVLYGTRSPVDWPAVLMYQLDKAALKAEAAKPQAPQVWPKQMQEANKKFEKGKYDDAAWEARKAINTAELGFGPRDERVITSLKMLVTIYEKQGRYNYRDAVPVYKRMVALAEETLGAEHPDVAAYLDGYAKALRNNGQEEEAQAAEARAAAIRQPR